MSSQMMGTRDGSRNNRIHWERLKHTVVKWLLPLSLLLALSQCCRQHCKSIISIIHHQHGHDMIFNCFIALPYFTSLYSSPDDRIITHLVALHLTHSSVVGNTTWVNLKRTTMTMTTKASIQNLNWHCVAWVWDDADEGRLIGWFNCKILIGMVRVRERCEYWIRG